ALKAVRNEMIATGLARGVINQRIGRIRRVFRWAVENELVPPSVFHGLQAVRGLQRGRTEAKETEPVKPVAEETFRAALRPLLPTLVAMAELQWLTGMRPGEVVKMRTCDLEMSGEIWFYRPSRHKSQWRGHDRVVPLGPRAQEILKPW